MKRRTFVKLLASTPLVAGDDAPEWKTRKIPGHKAVTQHKPTATPGMPGPYRGQVVSVKSENCLSKDGRQINAEIVREMMERGMRELTGERHAIDAWRQFIRPDDIVGVKVNVVGRPWCVSSHAVVAETVRNLMAANNDGVWNESGAAQEFYLEPRFYQTLWFYGCGALALALLGWVVFRARELRLKRQFEAVTAERNRIAREWHDTLVAGFAAISWQLEALAARIPESATVAQQQLEVARKMVKHSLTEARRALWDLRSNTASSDNLAAMLRDTLKPLLAGKPVALDFRVSGEPMRLSGDVETNLLRIGQEAVSNVVNHARAQNLQVELSFEPQSVRLQVSDDGCGFDAQQQTSNGHFGLIGMRERAMKLGCAFQVKSQPGSGTVVCVEVPLNGKAVKV